MKDLWIALILLVLILGGIIANSFYIFSVSSKLENITEKLDYNKDPEPLIDELENFWKENRVLLSFSVDTPQLDSIDIIILSLRLAYESEEEFEFEKYRLQLSEVSKEISILERFSLQTVF